MARMNMPAGPGRPKGIPNKATVEIKEAFRNLIEMNTPNMIGWMERVAETDPAKAIGLCASLAEFCIPKVARHIHAADSDAPLVTNPSADALIALMFAKGCNEAEIREYINSGKAEE